METFIPHSRRPNRSAASRRQQYARAHARVIQTLLRDFAALQHRGCQPTALGQALVTILDAKNAVPPTTCFFPGAVQTRKIRVPTPAPSALDSDSDGEDVWSRQETSRTARSHTAETPNLLNESVSKEASVSTEPPTHKLDLHKAKVDENTRSPCSGRGNSSSHALAAGGFARIVGFMHNKDYNGRYVVLKAGPTDDERFEVVFKDGSSFWVKAKHLKYAEHPE